MKLSDFDYVLPKELIAQEPLEARDESRLLIADCRDADSKGVKLDHKRFHDLLAFLSKGDVLVLNDTKVQPVKLRGKKISGAKAEFIISKRLGCEGGRCRYLCQITSNKVRPGNEFELDGGLHAVVLSESDGFEFEVEFSGDVEKAMDEVGEMPLPPYIKKKAQRSQYQTVYAKNPGSIAAPTAGFHFTPQLLRDIEAKGVEIVKITLHVGYGTFLPVKSEDVRSHRMHEEEYEITQNAADRINNRTGRLAVVGTTALRALESAADPLGLVQAGKGCTDLFVTPGYKFRLRPDMMITNFHLPKSTLIMLIAALVGLENVMTAYHAAVENRYRFYSFGDAMLLLI